MDGTSLEPTFSDLRVKSLHEISSEFMYSKDRGWKTKYTYFIESMIPYCGRRIPISEDLYKIMLGLQDIANLFPDSGYFFDISMITNV